MTASWLTQKQLIPRHCLHPSIHPSLSCFFFSFLWLTLSLHLSLTLSVSFAQSHLHTHTHTHTHTYYSSITQHPLTPDHVSRLPGWYRTVCPFHSPQLHSVVVMIIETFTLFSSMACTSGCCCQEQAPRPTGWKTRSDFHISALFTSFVKWEFWFLSWKTSNDRLAGGWQTNKEVIWVV